MKIRVAALIWKDGKILTLKYTYPKGNTYNLPGGNLEFGEDLKNGLRRELHEELNVESEVGDLVYVAEVINNETHTIHILFETVITENAPVINPLETKAEEIVWLNEADLKEKMLYPNIGKHISDKIRDIFIGRIEQPKF